MKTEFWRDWKRKTKLELKGVKIVKKVKKLLLTNFPKKEIISIYVQGSFIHRELNSKSDVDFVIVLKHSKYLPKTKKLEKKYKNSFEIPIHIWGVSIFELKKGKHTKFNKSPTGNPNRLVKQMPNFKLIYGKKLDYFLFPVRSDIKDLKAMIKYYKEILIPKYENGKLDFRYILKATFLLVENEQRIKGKNPPHSWKKLAKSIKNKNHIIHDTLRLRLHKTKDEKIRKKYVKKIERHLKCLERLI